MALDQVSQSSLQGGRIQRTAQAYSNRDIIGRAGTFQAVEEPEPALREGQGNLSRALEGLERRPCRLGLIKLLDQPGDSRGFEQAPDGRLDLERSPDAADEARSQERVAPQLKEAVVNADPWNTEGLGKERAEDLFLGSAWGAPGGAGARPKLRSRQRFAIQLAVGG